MPTLKARDKGADDVAQGAVMSTFRGYDLDILQLPHSARPRSEHGASWL